MYKHIQTRKNYDLLINSGMFWEFFPNLSGNWFEDREIIYSEIAKETVKSGKKEQTIEHNINEWTEMMGNNFS